MNWAAYGDDAQGILEDTAQGAGRDVLAALGMKDAFSLVDAFAVDYAKLRGAELVGRRVLSDGTIVDNPNPEWAITETTRDMVRDKVLAALEAGDSAQQLRADLLDDVFGVKRALMIARTEIDTAHNKGQLSGAQVAGMKAKAWLVADSVVCDDCEENGEAGVINVDSDFPSGDDSPTAHPHCRCTLVFYGAGETDTDDDDEE